MKKMMSLVIACFLMLSTLCMFMPASAATTTVSIGSATSDDCETVSIMIDTNVAAGIGSATMVVTYDPLVVAVNAVSAGDLGAVTPNDNNGVLTMTAVHATLCPTGNVKFADVEFCPVGQAGECSDLDLEVRSLYDCDVQAIVPDEVNDGEFCILGDATPKPDITAPADGATAEGMVTVDVIDLSGEGDIVYCLIEYLDGTTGVIVNDTAAPYSGVWDTTLVANGDYTIRATMEDGIGQTETDEIVVRVENQKCGDVNSNGEVDMEDVLLLIEHVRSQGGYEWAGDVTCDGEVNMGDVILLLNYVGDSATYELGCCE